MSQNAAYVSFISSLLTKCPALMDFMPDDDAQPKGWVKFINPTTGHRFLVPCSAQRMGVIHTSLPVAPGQEMECEGALSPPKGYKNGRIVAFFKADVDAVIEHLVPLLFNNALSLPAISRNASGGASSKAVTMTPSEIKASLKAQSPASGPVVRPKLTVPAITSLYEDAILDEDQLVDDLT